MASMLCLIRHIHGVLSCATPKSLTALTQSEHTNPVYFRRSFSVCRHIATHKPDEQDMKGCPLTTAGCTCTIMLLASNIPLCR